MFSGVNSCFDASNDDDDDSSSSGLDDIIFTKLQAMLYTRLIRRVIIYILPWPIIFAWLNNMRCCIKLLALHNLHSFISNGSIFVVIVALSFYQFRVELL